MTRHDSGAEASYTYQPSAFGAPRNFRLTSHALEWDIGRRSGQIPFGCITRVRMSYRPATLQNHRFVTEVWSTEAPKIDIVSTSWKSMVEQARLDDEYSAFIADLHHRLAAKRTAARFGTGVNPFIFWLGLIVFVAASVGLAGFTVHAVANGAGFGALVIAAFLLLFLWQGGNIFRRNLPGGYRPDELPPRLLPRRI